MTPVYLMEEGRPYKKALAANANTSSFPSKVPTTTEPANDGVIDLVTDGIAVSRKLHVVPYGLGSDDNTYDMKVLGWRHIGAKSPGNEVLWVPTTIGEFTVTLGSATGVALAPVLATELFADTIVEKSSALMPKLTGFDGSSSTTFQGQHVIYSPADNTVAWALIDLYGFEKIEFVFDQTGGTPTMNCLVAGL